MSRGPRRAGAALLAFVVALGAIGCTSGDDDGGGRPGGGPAGTPVDGGTLRIGLGGPIAVDPAVVSLANPADLMVLDLLHRGLTDVGADGGARPALATSWTADASFTAWHFALDPEATFASGRPVTSAQVVASLQHVIAGGDASLGALRLEDVVGFRAFLDGTAPTVEGLRALDEHTVEIDLASPMSVLPELLAAPAYGIEADPGGHPSLAGLDLSGDWAVDPTATRPERLELRRRTGARGHLAGIELQTFASADAAYDAFEKGEVDWAPVPGARYGAAVDAHGDDHFAPFQAELFLGMRTDAPNLRDARMRIAIAEAVDRDAIVQAVYPDLADVLDRVVPADVPGLPSVACQGCRHDPARARQLLAETFHDGAVPTVAIDHDSSPAQEAMASIVAEDLDAIGIPTTKRPLPLADYQRSLVAGGQELFSFGWVGGYSSPDAYLDPLFRSSSDDNLVSLRSPDVDKALAAARSSGDPAVRAAKWAAAEASVLSAAVVIPIAQFRTQVVVARRVEGFHHALDGTVDWAAVWLADAA